MGTRANVRAGLLLVLLCVLQRIEAVWLSLPASGTKCVSEEIQNNVVVLTDYVVISDDHVHPTPTISTKTKELIKLAEDMFEDITPGTEEVCPYMAFASALFMEAEMRIVSETTNARVTWFSIMALGICILVSIAQIWFLTRFFEKKKLI